MSEEDSKEGEGLDNLSWFFLEKVTDKANTFKKSLEEILVIVQDTLEDCSEGELNSALNEVMEVAKEALKGTNKEEVADAKDGD